MNKIILFNTALRAIMRHKIRSFLTILGIMIGIAAIIVTFSIGRGAEEKIKAQILAMGENAVYVIPGNVLSHRRGGAHGTITLPKLTVHDLEAVKAQCPEIKEISRGTHSMEILEYGQEKVREELFGADASMMKIMNRKVRSGQFFNQQQVQQRANVAVLGSRTAEKLFGIEDPLGKTIRINKQPFTVIGVLAKREHYWGIEDPNLIIFVPFTAAKKHFRKPHEAEDDLGAIAISLHEQANSDVVIRKIKRILRHRHNLHNDDEDDFMILDQQAMSQAAEQASGVIKLFGLIAASISLLVGGIGVMNIMLVSVQERTREIGLRIALGATQHIVQLQFLFEAITLCAIGGVIGIAFGYLSQRLVSNLTNLPSVIEIIPLIVSFVVTLLIGVFFGFYPARKASRLNPIDALLNR